MCINGKSAVIAICLMAVSLFGIAEGIKCFDGVAKTGSGTDAYQMLECEGVQNACFNLDCTGALAGSTEKGCNSDAIFANDICEPAFSTCHGNNGLTSGVKACSFCKGDLCNSGNVVTDETKDGSNKGGPPDNKKMSEAENGFTFHHPIAFSLLFAIGAMIAAVGHFLV